MKWIKCSERLPEEEVLLWDGKFVYVGRICTFFNGNPIEWETENRNTYDFAYFTHWMPLPEGPKDDI